MREKEKGASISGEGEKKGGGPPAGAAWSHVNDCSKARIGGGEERLFLLSIQGRGRE